MPWLSTAIKLSAGPFPKWGGRTLPDSALGADRTGPLAATESLLSPVGEPFVGRLLVPETVTAVWYGSRAEFVRYPRTVGVAQLVGAHSYRDFAGGRTIHLGQSGFLAATDSPPDRVLLACTTTAKAELGITHDTALWAELKAAEITTYPA